MQLLPIGNSLMYVRPWYVSATGSDARCPSCATSRSPTASGPTRRVAGGGAGQRRSPARQLDLGSVIGGSIAPPPVATGGGDGEPGGTTDDDDHCRRTPAAARPTRSRGCWPRRERLYNAARRTRAGRPGRVPEAARRGLQEGGRGGVEGDGHHGDALDDAARGDGDDRTARHRQRLARATAATRGGRGLPRAPRALRTARLGMRAPRSWAPGSS